MKPEDFRQLVTQIGTPIGLIGDYNTPSYWSHDEIARGVLTSYIVAERQDHGLTSPKWDTAALVILDEMLTTIDYEEKPFIGKHLLLFHRTPNAAFDNYDPNVHVYGIQNVEILNNPPLKFDAWRPHAVWLSSAAAMMIEDPLNLSDMAIAFRKRAMRNKGDTV